jgi:hypothetical protein
MRPLHSLTAFALTIKLLERAVERYPSRDEEDRLLVAHKPVCLEQGKRRYGIIIFLHH